MTRLWRGRTRLATKWSRPENWNMLMRGWRRGWEKCKEAKEKERKDCPTRGCGARRWREEDFFVSPKSSKSQKKKKEKTVQQGDVGQGGGERKTSLFPRKVPKAKRKRKKRLSNKGMWGKEVERGRLLCFPEKFQKLEEKRKKRLVSCS